MSDVTTGTIDPNKTKKAIIVNSLLAVSIIAAIIWGLITYYHLGQDAYTDDAQVQEYINPINIRIPGYIRNVRFEEHRFVKKGDTLIKIDDREYRIAVEQADAAYASALAAKNVTSSTRNTTQSNIGITDANIAASTARLWNAKQNYLRYKNLLDDSAATRQQFDQVKTEYDALAAQTLALRKQRNTTTLSTDEVGTRISVNDAEIKRAKAAVDLALLNLSYTVVLAPYDGFTGRRNVEEGQLVQAGQNLLTFVRNNDKWIIANFRETQIDHIHIGDKVNVAVDGLDQKVLIGTITAVSEATGSSYSAIPVDNSTGNFVKVQQRIPVKIRLAAAGNNKEDLALLKAGMNVEVRLAKK